MKRKKSRAVGRTGPGPVLVCIGWYTPEQYARLREASTDQQWFQWEAKATETLEILRAEGLAARKLAVDVEEMIAWCESAGKPFNSASRAEFISKKCRKQGIAETKLRLS
jgi:hypothetical protein